jgi:nucleoside-diphosphate-sugar epimerase
MGGRGCNQKTGRVGMLVLLTGHNGYIGSLMHAFLTKSGHEVVGLDIGYFAETDFIKGRGSINFKIRDVRDVESADEFKGFDAVIHLAALSNDPIGNLDPDWTQKINIDATLKLAQLAKKAGVKRFLFSSSCIMYGSTQTDRVDETSPLDPKTEYARSKVVAEAGLRDLAGDGFSPIYIRNGTVYGLSPRMRFDTVLNNFVGQAKATGKIIIYSNGQPWRPVVHVEDISRTFLQFLEAPREKVHNEAFNNGSDELNWRVIDLAKAVQKAVTGSEIELRAEAGADQRTYRASFEKFKRTFPDFRFKWNPETGAAQLAEAFESVGLDKEKFESDDFTRLKWLQGLLNSGRLDKELRWTKQSGWPSQTQGKVKL